MTWVKINLTLVLCLILVGCGSKVEVGNDITYQEALQNTLNADSFMFTNKVSAKYGGNELNTESLYLVDNEIGYSENSQDIDSSIANIIKRYIIDGVSYFEMGEEKYKVVDNSNIREDIKHIFASDNITDIKNTVKDGIAIFHITLNEEASTAEIQSLIDNVGINQDNVKGSTYSVIAKATDKIIEYTKITTIEMIDSDNKFIYEEKYEFSKYNEVNIELPDDLDSYLDIEEETSDDVKTLLVEHLGYVADNNVYTLVFNDNETFIFDFNNNIFTYTLITSSSSYNFKTNIGVFNNCTYDFNTSSGSGSCDEEEIQRILDTKVYIGIELDSIGKMLSDIK